MRHFHHNKMVCFKSSHYSYKIIKALCSKYKPLTVQSPYNISHYNLNLEITGNQASRQECVLKNYFLYFSSKTYVVGTQKNHLNEMVLWAPKTHF